MRTLRASLALLSLLAATPLSARPITEEPRNRELDHGKFTIKIRNHVIGAENFGIEARADSINCLARSSVTQRTDKGDEQIEKFVTDDPQVLERVGGLSDMYKKYERLAYDAEQKCAKATAKTPADRRYNEHMRDLELFKQTNGLIADMWERMGH